MGLVARPPKAAGTSQYQTEFAAGAIGIQDTEVDADFETLYRLVNGNLDTTNIAAHAAITYDQLSLTGRIMNADISASANIDGHKIAAGTIPASALAATSIGQGQLADNSVTSAKIVDGTIALADIAISGTVAGMAVNTGANNAVTPSVETALAEVTWTTRGGTFLLFATLNGYVQIQAPGQGTLYTRIRIDNSAPGAADGLILQSTQQQIGEGVGVVPLSVTLVAFRALESVGQHRAQLTVFVTPGAAGIVLDVNNPAIAVWEPA